MMRVLHTVAGLNEVFGGPSRSVPSLCVSLANECEWVGLASQHFEGLESPMLMPPEGAVEMFLIPGVYSARTRIAFSRHSARHLKSILRSREVTVLHDHGAWQWFNHAAVSAANEIGIPVVLSPRGMLMKWPMSKSVFRKKILLFLFQRRDFGRVQAFIATSDEEAADLRVLGFRQPIAVIPNGVSVPEGRGHTTQNSSVRRMVFLSRIHPKKGLANLLRAWALVRPRNWRLVIAGPSERGHDNELETLAAALNITSEVEFPGAIHEANKVQFLESAAIVILPSESENFGMVIAESLAVGRPVIASTGTPWASLAEKRCGWWVHNDVGSLERTIIEATAMSPLQLIEMGERGRELARSSYSWEAVGQRTARFYDWVIQGGQAPAYVNVAEHIEVSAHPQCHLD